MTAVLKKMRRAAREHHHSAVRQFHKTHKHARRLLKKHKVVLAKVREHAVRTAAVASISTGILAGPALAAGPAPQPAADNTVDAPAQSSAPVTPIVYGPSIKDANKAGTVKDRLNTVAPGTSHTVTLDQEAALSQVIQETFGITAKAELDGIRLNHLRGTMAGEQHLPLYKGDGIKNHYKNRITGKVADPTASLTGMVPGLPSWGYFAPNAASVTKQDVEREQWYIAAQTFLSPGWQQNTQQMYNWYKYRKVIVINQETGQAVVADIADAGPSPATKRSFGGSNEVLIALGLGSKRTGTVITMFVDDPTDSIPLGPLTGYNP